MRHDEISNKPSRSEAKGFWDGPKKFNGDGDVEYGLDFVKVDDFHYVGYPATA